MTHQMIIIQRNPRRPRKTETGMFDRSSSVCIDRIVRQGTRSNDRCVRRPIAFVRKGTRTFDRLSSMCIDCIDRFRKVHVRAHRVLAYLAHERRERIREARHHTARVRRRRASSRGRFVRTIEQVIYAHHERRDRQALAGSFPRPGRLPARNHTSMFHEAVIWTWYIGRHEVSQLARDAC